VFRAHDERLGRTVALKILAPELAADKEFRSRFIRESRAAAATDHPHIIPIFEAGKADGVLFIAMRFVRGGDLGSRLGQFGPLPPEAVATIVSQTSSALDAAHKHGLVHRDIKPCNLLVDAGDAGRPDHVYLSDFGLSKDSVAVGALAALTSAGQVLGTLDYMAPEQIGGKSVDGRADQYGLACTAYELLCGQPPFGESPGTALLRAHLMDQPPPVTSRRPDLPASVDAVFAKALSKAPADRYATCSKFAGALREVFGLEPYRSGPHIATKLNHPAGNEPARNEPARNPHMPKPAPLHGGPVLPPARAETIYPPAAETVIRGRPADSRAAPHVSPGKERDGLDPNQAAAPAMGEQAQARARWRAWRGQPGPGN